MMNCKFFTTFLFLLVFLTVHGQTYTWDGGAGTDQWQDANNWDSNLVPLSSIDVVINTGDHVEIPSGLTANSNTISVSANSNLTVTATATLNVFSTTGVAITIQGATIENYGAIVLDNFQTGISLSGTTTSVENHGSITMSNYTGFAMELNSGCDGCEFISYGTFSINGGGSSSRAVQIKNTANSKITNHGSLVIGTTGNLGGAIALGNVGGVLENYGDIQILETGGSNPGIAHGFVAGTVTNHSGATIVLSDLIGNLVIGGSNLNLHNDGNIEINKNQNLNLILSGSGSFTGSHPFNNTNIISPGNSPGCLAFNSGYSITGTTNMELSGTIACIDHDRINAGLIANISGTLNVSLINGFVPVAGQSFTLINAGEDVVGTFTTVNLPTVSGINFTIDYNTASVVLNAESSLFVELVSFDARAQEQLVELHWMTATEINNSGFTIERKSGNSEWKAIGFVEGKGDAFIENKYLFEDLRPLPGNNYYRLKQVDFDGQWEYSDVENVSFSVENDIEIFPNPTTNVLHLSTTLKFGTFKIRILNFQGKEVGRPEMEDFEIQVGDLEKGIYFLEVDNGVLPRLQRFIIQ